MKNVERSTNNMLLSCEQKVSPSQSTKLSQFAPPMFTKKNNYGSKKMSNSSEKSNSEQVLAQHRGWIISKISVNNRLWLRWQHPQESFARYGCMCSEEGLEEKLAYTISQIDLIIELESTEQIPDKK
ncbi:MAG: hypothetical protein SAL07_08565 [Oscillatoria sp. PMC 1051.18]|nr:hypothetical protein [Oscillatoria sp. PMC 1050.18]MEC5029951.1 hypothetical protein [Oscillatoria sp. PMC 1051.18]